MGVRYALALLATTFIVGCSTPIPAGRYVEASVDKPLGGTEALLAICYPDSADGIAAPDVSINGEPVAKIFKGSLLEIVLEQGSGRLAIASPGWERSLESSFSSVSGARLNIVFEAVRLSGYVIPTPWLVMAGQRMSYGFRSATDTEISAKCPDAKRMRVRVTDKGST
jgi:hypothetical protein